MISPRSAVAAGRPEVTEVTAFGRLRLLLAALVAASVLLISAAANASDARFDLNEGTDSGECTSACAPAKHAIGPANDGDNVRAGGALTFVSADPITVTTRNTLIKPLVARARRGVIRVPRNRIFAAVKVSCPDGICRILRAVTNLRVRGKAFNSHSRFNRKGFAPGRSRTVKVKLGSQRAWKRLKKGKKSGVVLVTVTSKSTNGMRASDTFRFGLKR